MSKGRRAGHETEVLRRGDRRLRLRRGQHGLAPRAVLASASWCWRPDQGSTRRTASCSSATCWPRSRHRQRRIRPTPGPSIRAARTPRDRPPRRCCSPGTTRRARTWSTRPRSLPFGSTSERFVGGTGNHWMGTAIRMDGADFTLRSTYGHGLDWPLGYDELEPVLPASGTARRRRW